MKCSKKKAVLTVLMIALLLIGAVGGTVAYLSTKTEQVENVFQPSAVPSEVEETFSNNVKSDVVIRNNGNVNAYIRAAVVVTWKNEQGQIYPGTPADGTDYEIDWKKSGWSGPDANGFYYHNDKVAAGQTTGQLFTNCKPIDDRTPEGYYLNVEILGQAIQAEGMGATSAQDAWDKAKSN